MRTVLEKRKYSFIIGQVNCPLYLIMAVKLVFFVFLYQWFSCHFQKKLSFFLFLQIFFPTFLSATFGIIFWMHSSLYDFINMPKWRVSVLRFSWRDCREVWFIILHLFSGLTRTSFGQLKLKVVLFSGTRSDAWLLCYSWSAKVMNLLMWVSNVVLIDWLLEYGLCLFKC